MIKKYSKQGYTWGAAAVIVLVICYQLAFKKTIEAWELNKRLTLQMRQSSDVSVPPGYLKRKEKNLDRLLDLFKPGDNNSRGEIINKVSIAAESEHLKVEEVPLPDTSAENGGYVIQRMFLSGEYFAALRTLHKLEQNNEAGMIRSLTLKTAKTQDIKNDKKLLLEISFEREK